MANCAYNTCHGLVHVIKVFLQCLGIETVSEASTNERELKVNETNIHDPPPLTTKGEFSEDFANQRELKINETSVQDPAPSITGREISEAFTNQRELKTNETTIQDPPSTTEREVTDSEDVSAEAADSIPTATPPRPPINPGGGGQTN
ncbi:hypothetical protein L1049_002469 [Liquidambar formosana]|uniref:Uncharacterized protein n=1 Tax=Liquidambar formosana TaxID=63359 RepID=A0AAP0R7F8_LIQFO